MASLPEEPEELDDSDVVELDDDDLSPEDLAQLEQAQEVLLQPSLPPPAKRDTVLPPPAPLPEEKTNPRIPTPAPPPKRESPRYLTSGERNTLETIAKAATEDPDAIDAMFDRLRMPTVPPPEPPPPDPPTIPPPPVFTPEEPEREYGPFTIPPVLDPEGASDSDDDEDEAFYKRFTPAKPPSSTE